MTSVECDFPPGLFLDRERYENLLAEWLNPDGEHRSESLICLLLLLYGQKVSRVFRLKVSDVLRDREGGYRVALGRTEIPLDRRIGDLLGR